MIKGQLCQRFCHTHMPGQQLVIHHNPVAVSILLAPTCIQPSQSKDNTDTYTPFTAYLVFPIRCEHFSVGSSASSFTRERSPQQHYSNGSGNRAHREVFRQGAALGHAGFAHAPSGNSPHHSEHARCVCSDSWACMGQLQAVKCTIRVVVCRNSIMVQPSLLCGPININNSSSPSAQQLGSKQLTRPLCCDTQLPSQPVSSP